VTFCKVEQIPCANDTECPSTWQCVVEPGTAPGEPTTAKDAGSASVEPGKAARLALVDAGAMDASVLVATLADAQVVALAVDASAAPSGYCQPPYYSGGPKGDDGTATGGDGEAPEEATDSGSVPVHQADAGGQGPSVTQEPGTEPTGAALDASAPSGENDAGKTDSEATQTSGDSGDDGCSCTVVGAESTQSRGALTAALGLLGGLVLRQSRGKRRQRAA
jgi:hypothetical protein